MARLPVDPVESAFEEVQAHAHQHAVDVLLFRVRVGQALVNHLADGDFEALRASLDQKDSLYSAFVRRHGGVLTTLGLRPDTLRRCLTAAEVAEGMSEADFRDLGFTRLVALAPVADPAWRQALTRLALDNDWTVAELRAAIAHADAGTLTDGDGARPGLQPLVPTRDKPDEAAPAGPAKMGRPLGVVVRLRGAVGAVDALAAWLNTQPKRAYTPQQRAEAWRQVDVLEARLAAVKAALPAREGQGEG